MNGVIRKLKDHLGNYMFPVTSTKCVYNEDGTTLLKDKLNDIDTNIGDKTALETTSKTNLVNAINEVVMSLTDKAKKHWIDVTSFGAKGDGLTDDTLAIQNAINSALPYQVVYFPSKGAFYKCTNLIIPQNKTGLKLLGDGTTQSVIKLSSVTSISVQAEGVYCEGLRIYGAGLTSPNSCIFKDERPSNRADFDIDIQNCYLSGSETAVSTMGRGVIIEECTLYEIRYYAIKADFPLLATFEPGIENSQSYETGFRGFIFRNNRVHYSPCMILNNVGANKLNLCGVLITGNELEGSTGYIEGYVKNGVVSNNVHYHCGNIREALFMLHGCDNLNIDVNISGMKLSDDGFDSYCNKIIHCTGEYNNLTVNANIQDVWKDVFYFSAGGKNLDIKVNANNICKADTSLYNLVKFEVSTSVYSGVKITGAINSPATNFTAVKRSGNLVERYNIDLDITNDFLSYSNLDATKEGTRKRISGIYVGDGTVNRQILIKQQPSVVQVFSNTFYGTKHALSTNTAPNITINASGFTVTLTANTDGEVYTYATS